MRRPIIGICTYLDDIRWGVWQDRAAMVPAGYVDAVQRAGGVAVLLPPDREALHQPDPVLDLLDGLILAGGVDVSPETYGADAHPQTDTPNEDRDAFELALAGRALERDIPVLGICRGMQVMNVAAGGTLHQHLPELVGHETHRHTPGRFTDHDVRLEEGSLAERATGIRNDGRTKSPSVKGAGRTPAAGNLITAKSHHHQGVDVLGDGFVVSGWSALDDLPEAIERPERRFALGVQWHPEADETSRLIAALVEEARSGV